jgi:hypothetical protein
MRKYRISSIMALIVIVALSIWVGMQIEKARSGHRPVSNAAYIVNPARDAAGHAGTGQTYIVTQPVRQVTSGQTQPTAYIVNPARDLGQTYIVTQPARQVTSGQPRP